MTEFIKITDQGLIPIKSTDLVKSNDPILKQVAPPFDFSQGNAVNVANQLVEALQLHKGLGLSACQIGLNYRVFVMGSGDQIVAYFNPFIVEYYPETVLSEEGCLSFPGLFIKVRRTKTVQVEYQDFNGNFHKKRFDDLTARIFQHELDHLNGKTFLDVAGPLAVKMAKKRFEKEQKRKIVSMNTNVKYDTSNAWFVR